MTKDEILETVTMEDVLARYDLEPNRAGFILCPFHRDNNPSMKIYPKRFHCFACQADGDVFQFVQQYEDCSFPEAFRKLGGSYSRQSRRQRADEYRRTMQRQAQAAQAAAHEKAVKQAEEALEEAAAAYYNAAPLSEDFALACSKWQLARYHLDGLLNLEPEIFLEAKPPLPAVPTIS